MPGSQGSLPPEESLSLSFDDLLALPLAPSVQRHLFAALLPLVQRRAGPGKAQTLERLLRHEILKADLHRCREEALAGHWCEALDRLAALVLPCRREGLQPALRATQLELVERFWQSLIQLDDLPPQALPLAADRHWALQAVLIDLQSPDLQSPGLDRPSWLIDADWNLSVRGLALHLRLEEPQGAAAWRLDQRLLVLVNHLFHHDVPAPPWVEVHVETRLRLAIARLVAAGSPVEYHQLMVVERWALVLRQLRTTAMSPDKEGLVSFAIIRHLQVISRSQSGQPGGNR
ncbi:MAG: hypothetical protein NTV57_11740 [Cyanobacteria bacterium]|nr:hypothetical protein [Cyanobacteriota bacterium]